MSYLNDIQNEELFLKTRKELLQLLSSDDDIYMAAMSLFVSLMKYDYISSKNWMGIPIVKLPEDIVVLQEFYFENRPTAVIEVGVARGGSISLAYSLQKLNGINPKILGIDIKILPHTRIALEKYEREGILTLLEANSVSKESQQAIKNFVEGEEKVFVILDGNHSHDHVKAELEMLEQILSVDSVVLVADGIIEHLPERDDRPWGKGNNPLTAVKNFLQENSNWQKLDNYSRKSFFSEFRDGWIIKKSNR